MAGRPTDYTPEIAQLICSRIAEGEFLTKICKEDSMPCVTSVYAWQMKHPEFAALYARAREDQADTLADEIVAISDDGSRDYAVNDDGIAVVDHDHIQRSKLRVDARKWVAAKLKPKKYGDSASLKLGGDPDNPAPVNVTVSLNFDEVVSKLKK